MRALAGTQVPVPRVHALCEDDAVIGSAFYVMEFLDGRIFWDQRLPEIASPAERGAMFNSMNAVIAALHNVDYAAVGLGDFGRPGNYMGRQIARWSRQYRASETETIAAMDRLIDWLPQHIPPESAACDRPRRLPHGQSGVSQDRAAGHRRARLGIVDDRRPARRFRLSRDDVAGDAGAVPRPRRDRFRGVRHPGRGGLCRRLLPAHRARRRSPPGISTWSTACSASPRSCRGSPSARSTAPPPAPKPPKSAASPARWPSRPGRWLRSLR